MEVGTQKMRMVLASRVRGKLKLYIMIAEKTARYLTLMDARADLRKVLDLFPTTQGSQVAVRTAFSLKNRSSSLGTGSLNRLTTPDENLRKCPFLSAMTLEKCVQVLQKKQQQQHRCKKVKTQASEESLQHSRKLNSSV